MSRAREFADLAGSADAGGLTGRNLIINGDFQVNQRSTSGDWLADRQRFLVNGSYGAFTRTVETLSSGSPYDAGFRKFGRVTVDTATNHTDSYELSWYRLEAQDIAKSGWDYTSPNSSITMSFWVRSSVADTYYFQARTVDGTEYIYNSTFALTANTWKKVTVTMPGNSNLQFDDNANAGLTVAIVADHGATYIGGEEATTNSWYTRGGNNDAYFPSGAFAAEWANVANATFDWTGMQLEVGDKATPFQHRSYGEELTLCQRYCHVWKSGQAYDAICMMGTWSDNSSIYGTYSLPVEMRADPTVTYSGSFEVSAKGNSASGTTPTTNRIGKYVVQPRYNKASHGLGSGISGWMRDSNDSDATITFDAEL
jgi:hypothetical protein